LSVTDQNVAIRTTEPPHSRVCHVVPSVRLVLWTAYTYQPFWELTDSLIDNIAAVIKGFTEGYEITNFVV